MRQASVRKKWWRNPHRGCDCRLTSTIFIDFLYLSSPFAIDCHYCLLIFSIFIDFNYYVNWFSLLCIDFHYCFNWFSPLAIDFHYFLDWFSLFSKGNVIFMRLSIDCLLIFTIVHWFSLFFKLIFTLFYWLVLFSIEFYTTFSIDCHSRSIL